MTGRRPLLGAVVGPRAAYLIARDYGEKLEAQARALIAYRAQADAGRELLAAVEQLREAGRQWKACRESDGPVFAADEVLVSTVQVAERLRVSDRQVRKLIAAGDLPAARRGGRGRWQVRVEDLEAYEAEFRNSEPSGAA